MYKCLNLVCVIVVALTARLAGCASHVPTEHVQSRGATPFRAIWVTRWDYRSEADVKRAISDAASLGVTDVMWQVRGQCDAYYKSDLEPWGETLLKDLPPGVTAPTFDPLSIALAEAHAKGLKVHAWMNMMPLWKGTTAPKAANHPFHTHPEWRLRDAKGVAQALNEHYVIVNPVLPAVQDHIVAVCRDIVSRYPIDGIHMDYIRFVSDTMKDPAAYPGDADSLAQLAITLGRAVKKDASGKLVAEDAAAFRDLKRDSITRIVRRIRVEAIGSRRDIAFSAAVWRRPELARDQYLQDAVDWLRTGTLDRAMPMIYTDKQEQFQSDLDAWIAAGGKRITPGIANYLHTPEQTSEQIDYSVRRGAAGVAIFAYSSLFESVDPNQDKRPAEVQKRAARRESLRSLFARQGDVPRK
ncbi:MAG: glycoside hydrolase family 10 protein [Phycisphaerales bacterium]